MEGIGKICSICGELLKQTEADNYNPPMRIVNMPGFCHARCKANFDSMMISTGRTIEVYPKNGF